MSLEGLNTVLGKEEVVVTFQAQDLIEHPKTVYDAYKIHLRTYVPMHSGSSDDYLSVEAFAKRFIQAVENGKVPRGYITADFGFGKTSTGLYLWETTSAARFLSVPPFQLNTLADFVRATYGWVDYIFGQVQPSLQDRVREIYHLYNSLSIKALATRYQIDEQAALKITTDRPQILEMTPQDATSFFRETTQLAIDAGFRGLVVIADEVQQYLEPEVKSGKSDPIGPLFNLIQSLGGQTNLAFGLLLIIPSKELGVINDQRGDLVDRLRNHALDLKTIYDRGFPTRLWNHLAQSFNFDSYSGKIIRNETLYSLGQIAVRADLANGPRTVVNAFRSAIKHYLANESNGIAYTPIDLINDFMSGENAYDGTKRIQEIVGKALENNNIRGDLSQLDAIRLAAAFPIDGATKELQNAFGLLSAFETLRKTFFGEIVLEVGDRTNPGTTLCGLEAEEEQVDWLLLSIRDFSRNYHENSALIKTRALNGFKALLKTNIFKNDWKIIEENEPDLISSAGMIIEGTFASFRKEFPGRTAKVVIIFDDEPARMIDQEYDLDLHFRLRRYLELDDKQRQSTIIAPTLDENLFSVIFDLNIARRLPSAFNRAVENLLVKVVAPEQLTPLFALSLYGYFQTLNSQGRVPKTEQPILTMQIMPGLLDGITNILFNKDVGGKHDASGQRLIEKLAFSLLRSRYGTNYHTLMVVATWRNSLRDYANMIRRLPTPLHRQGFLTIHGTKDEIAKQLNLSNTSLDNFVDTFPDLIEIIGDFRNSRIGDVRFKFHPLEEIIKEWITSSSQSTKVQGKIARSITKDTIISQAKYLGYTFPEVEQAIKLLIERGWAVLENEALVCEIPSSNIKPENVLSAANILAQRVALGRRIFPEAMDIRQLETQSLNFSKLASQSKTLNSKYWELLLTQIEMHLGTVQDIFQYQINGLKNKVHRLIEKFQSLQIPDLPTRSIYVRNTPFQKHFDLLFVKFDTQQTKLITSLKTVEQNIEKVQNKLLMETVSDEDLESITSQIILIEHQLTEFENAMDAFSKNVKGYYDWEDVFRLRQDVLSKLDQLPGENTLRTSWKSIDREILNAISDESLGFVLRSSSFNVIIRKMLEQTQHASGEAKKSFEGLQDKYKTGLLSIDCSTDTFSQYIIFSPLEPEKVYEQLYALVQNALLTTLDNTDEQIQQLCSQLRQITLTDNSSDAVKQSAKGLEKELANLSSQLPYASINRLDLIKDEKDFYKTIQQIKSIQSKLKPYNAFVSELYQQVDLSQSEMLLISLLPSDETKNLADLLNETGFASDDNTWLTFKNLWDNNWIQIVVRRLPRK